MPGWQILVVSRDGATVRQMTEHLSRTSCEVTAFCDAAQALRSASEGFEVAFVDLDLPGALDAARRFGSASPQTLVAVMGSPAVLLEHSAELLALRLRVVQKPVAVGQVLTTIEQAEELRSLRAENQLLRERWEDAEILDDFISRNPRMIEAICQAATAAESSEPVFISGAPGTEKEILALYIHRCGERADRPFVRFECGRLPPSDEEKELFGGESRGHSTGRLALACGGTLFMENIGALSPGCQARLLRFLDDDSRRRGRESATDDAGFSPAPADVRIICAPAREMNDGVPGLREDLLYRLNALCISIPPLSQRRQDILPLAERFLCRFAGEAGKIIGGMSDEAARCLLEYNWPGNVQELRSLMWAAAAGARRNLLVAEDLCLRPFRRKSAAAHSGQGAGVRSLRRSSTGTWSPEGC